MEAEEGLRQQLEELQKQMEKKQKFEEAVSSFKSLFHDRYPSASPSLRKSFYSVVSRVATILRTRYTAPGFWQAGLELFELAQSLTPDAAEKDHLTTCIAQAKEHLGQIDVVSQPSSSRGYLFEGHLTVDREPPLPLWMLTDNLLESLESLMLAQSSAESHANLIDELESKIDDLISEVVSYGHEDDYMPEITVTEDDFLPEIAVTEEEIPAKLGHEAECAICENLVVYDNMQELPCKHTFHQLCLMPWRDEDNCCPICRPELLTWWKEREKEDEERKGAANALRGGEYMYV